MKSRSVHVRPSVSKMSEVLCRIVDWALKTVQLFYSSDITCKLPAYHAGLFVEMYH